jgi:hypothetical protein
MVCHVTIKVSWWSAKTPDDASHVRAGMTIEHRTAALLTLSRQQEQSSWYKFFKCVNINSHKLLESIKEMSGLLKATEETAPAEDELGEAN